ncbi:MAG: lysylphosphatidylglycerol synthase transmembrane domain-containing protein [Methanomassiliicoccales archaeon]|nr:lysylphosphatidylglycerol synthase transmembrane domain-containing protein [Methanomassiliicoccales archaeon]
MGRIGLGTKIKLGVSIALIVLVVLYSDPGEMGEALSGVNLWLIGLVVILYLINMAFKAYRWGVLMEHAGHDVPFRSTFTAFSLSQAINNLIPGRVVGETSRIVDINTREGVSMGKGLATVVTERIMDFVVLTVLSVTSLVLLLAYIVEDLRGYLIFMVAVMVVANIFFIYILAKPALLVRLGAWAARKMDRLFKGEKGTELSAKMMGMIGSFNEALTFKGNRKLMVWAAVLTVFIWVNEIARLFLIIMALGAEVSLVAVVAASSLASLSGVLLAAGSGNVVMSSAVFTAAKLDVHIATTAGVLSALTSIWLAVPVSLIAMLVDHRLGPPANSAKSSKTTDEKKGLN